MLLSFPELIQWCDKRQKQLAWTNKTLADKSKVPEGTIKRIKAGDYLDCKYSTIRSIVITLIGGTTDEFPCNAQVEKELQQMEVLEKQATKLTAVEQENEAMKLKLEKLDEQYHTAVRAIREEYMEQITFLKDELKAWRAWHQKAD
jgi:predicted transcriptional regulator